MPKFCVEHTAINVDRNLDKRHTAAREGRVVPPFVDTHFKGDIVELPEAVEPSNGEDRQLGEVTHRLLGLGAITELSADEAKAAEKSPDQTVPAALTKPATK